MNEAEATQLANSFLQQTLGRKLKLIGVRKPKGLQPEWAVLYETTNSEGKLFDGPTVVIVDERDRSAKFYPGI